MTSTKLVSCFALLALVAVMPIFAMHHEKNQDIVDTADLKASRLGSVNHVACEPIPLPLLSASSSACPSDP